MPRSCPIAARACVPALALLACAPAACAQSVYFPDDATINSTVNGTAIIGRDAQGNNTSPTISLITGGNITARFQTYNSSTFNISGGTVGGGSAADVNDSSTLNITSGTLNTQIASRNTSRVNISGGTVQSFSLTDSSVVDQSGGLVTGQTILSNSSLINLFGMNRSAMLTDADYFGYSRYSLAGSLTDGTSVDGRELFVRNGQAASFTLNVVPGPEALPLFGGGLTALGLLLRCRKRRPIVEAEP